MLYQQPPDEWRDDLRYRLQGLRKAEHTSLLSASCGLCDETRDRWTNDAC